MYLSCLAVSEFVLRKSIPMLGSFKHFTENGIRFTENQFPCLVHSNILQKMKFVLQKINFHVWFVDHFTENTKCLTNSAPALPRQTYNSTKIIIHFNIKNNHPNIPIIFISKQPHQSFTIGITPSCVQKWYLHVVSEQYKYIIWATVSSQ